MSLPVTYTVEEIAKALHRSEKTVRRLIHTGALKAVKIGREFRVMEKDLKEFLKPLATKGDLEKISAKTDRLEAKTDRIEKTLTDKIAASEEHLAESIRGINFSLSQHLSRIEGKVDYIAQNAALRTELRNLVSQLKAQGINLDESKIFAV